MPGKKRCGIFGPDDVVKASASCGLYLQGKPHDDQPIQAIVSPEAAGYVEGKVRCENCSWYDDGICGLLLTWMRRCQIRLTLAAPSVLRVVATLGVEIIFTYHAVYLF